MIDISGNNQIFVFGSNEAGRHGAGAAAAAARLYGAVYGEGYGLQGQSFAIPTKDRHIKTLHFSEVESYVYRFLDFAADHPEYTFYMTAIGTGLAGFTHEQMAELFVDAPDNILYDLVWKPYLPKTARFWGTF